VEGVRRSREKRYLVKEERATDDFLRMDAAVMEVDEEEVDVEKDAVLLEVEVEDGGISFFFSDGEMVLDLIDWEVEDEGDEEGDAVIGDDNVVVAAADEVDDDEVDISSDLDLAAELVVDNDRIIIIVFIVCDE